MDPYLIIISLAIIIIISHFLNVYSDNTGVPSVLILILFGFLLQLDTTVLHFEILDPGNKKFVKNTRSRGVNFDTTRSCSRLRNK